MESLAVQTVPVVSELVDDYLAACAARNLSIESIKLYRHGLNRFIAFGDVPASEIEPRYLRRFIFSMQSDGLSSSTVRDYFGHVKSFLGFLHDEHLISANPASKVPQPRKAKKLPRVLSDTQAQALLDTCPDYSWTGRRDKTAIFLLLGSGIRLAEILRLDLDDINPDAGELHVVGKGSKERTVSVDEDVVSVILGWLPIRLQVLNGKPTNALFVNRSKRRMGKSFGQTVKNYARSAGFFCTPHTCRHSYATDWIRNGGDLQRLKIQLGHSHISMTEKYVHLARKDFQDAANQYSITKRLRFDSRQMQFDMGRKS